MRKLVNRRFRQLRRLGKPGRVRHRDLVRDRFADGHN
jgi:hypothetical protein